MLRLRGDRKPGVPLRLGQHGQGGVFVQFATLAEVQFACISIMLRLRRPGAPPISGLQTTLRTNDEM